MSDERFELICEFVHCKEKRIVIVGTADSDISADKWVKEQQDLAAKGIFNYRDGDFKCPVTLCPMKDCVPAYSYRKSSST